MKFWTYYQNNSGGCNVVNDRVAKFVFIEAESAEDADNRAEEIGIYFNGCETGRDCDCCGDRWDRAYEQTATAADALRSVYDWCLDQDPAAHVYTADGAKQSFTSEQIKTLKGL